MKNICVLLFLLSVISIYSQESEICGDGIDNDLDLLIDCADPECADGFACNGFPCAQISELYQIRDGVALYSWADMTWTEVPGWSNPNHLHINAIGYNVQDGYLYGIETGGNADNLIRITSTGIENLGVPANMPSHGSGSGWLTGDFDLNGNLYVTATNVAYMAVIDVINVTATQVNFVPAQPFGAPDWAFVPATGQFYGINDEFTLRVMNPNGTLAPDINLNFPGNAGNTFGSMFADANGNLYASSNGIDGQNFGEFYQLTPDATFTNFVVTPITGQAIPVMAENDGAACPLANGLVDCSCSDPLIISPIVPACSSDPQALSFDLSVLGGCGSGFWTTTGGSIESSHSIETTITGLPIGETTVTWTDDFCDTSVSAVISNNISPIAAINVEPSTVLCEGQEATAYAISDASAGSIYQWGCSSVDASGTSNSYEIPTTFSGPLCVNVIDAETGCAIREEVEIERLDCSCGLDPEILATEVSDCKIISFMGLANPGITTSVIGYSWDFGDGTTGEGEEISHVYPHEGYYIVTLSVMGSNEDGDCCVISTTKQIKVDCVCSVDAAFYAEASYCLLTASYTGSTDPSSIISYAWDMGNGTILSGESIEYNYPEGGTYAITLTVMGHDENECCTSSSVREVELNCPFALGCGAKVTINHELASPDNNYEIWADIDPGAGSTVYGYAWYLDGELIGNEATAFADLESGSLYDVCLVLTMEFDGQCCEEEYCTEIEVASPCNEVIISVENYDNGSPWVPWDKNGTDASYTTRDLGCLINQSVQLRNNGAITNSNIDVNNMQDVEFSFCYVNESWPAFGQWDSDDLLVLEGRVSGGEWGVIAEYGSSPVSENVTVQIGPDLISSGFMDLRLSIDASGGNLNSKRSWVDNLVVKGCLLSPSPTVQDNQGGDQLNGNAKLFSSDEISIYPNPASDVLHVNISASSQGRYQLDILDSQGKKVLSESIIANDEKSLTSRIDVSELANGVYSVSLTSAMGTNSSSLVISK